MTPPGTGMLPDDAGPAKKLISDHIDTFEKLEILVSVVERPNETWTLDSISAALEISPAQLRPQIDQLRAAGILRLVPGRQYRFTYTPSSAELRAACDAICGAFKVERGAVIREVSQVAIERARRSGADAFAGAFLIRRPKEDRDDG